MTSANIKLEANKNVSAAKGQLSVGKKTEGNVSFSVTSRGRTQSSTLKTRVAGGNTKALNDMDAWREGAALNPTVVSYNIEPTFALVNCSKNRNAHDHLKAAYSRVVDSFLLPTFDEGALGKEEYSVSVIHHEDWLGYTRNADIVL